MQDISMYTPNAQKFIRLGWEACEVDDDDEEEFDRIIEERGKFCNENFILEDFDSMIEFTRASSSFQECSMWIQERERYIAEHPQKPTLEDMKKQMGFKEAN